QAPGQLPVAAGQVRQSGFGQHREKIWRRRLVVSDSGGRGFLSRWSQRKSQARNERAVRHEADARQTPADEVPAHDADVMPGASQSAPAVSPQASASSPAAVERAPLPGPQESPDSPLPTLEDVKRLTAVSD